MLIVCSLIPIRGVSVNNAKIYACPLPATWPLPELFLLLVLLLGVKQDCCHQDFPIEALPRQTSTRSSTTHKLVHNYTRTSTHRHFYFNRIIRLWNNLPPIDLSKSVQCIKSHLYSHLWNNFLCNFDPNDTCSFHYLCPCSSCLT